jgi:hypothetical protein
MGFKFNRAILKQFIVEIHITFMVPSSIHSLHSKDINLFIYFHITTTANTTVDHSNYQIK